MRIGRSTTERYHKVTEPKCRWTFSHRNRRSGRGVTLRPVALRRGRGRFAHGSEPLGCGRPRFRSWSVTACRAHTMLTELGDPRRIGAQVAPWRRAV